MSKGDISVITIDGPSGSGKTTFTQALARALGIVTPVLSPTFVIERIYKIENSNKFEHLIHIDAYRLENGQELTNLGWEKICQEPRNLIVIEWPERVADILPTDIYYINFEFVDENTRNLEW